LQTDLFLNKLNLREMREELVSLFAVVSWKECNERW
jgi:hypothetical protein